MPTKSPRRVPCAKGSRVVREESHEDVLAEILDLLANVTTRVPMPEQRPGDPGLDGRRQGVDERPHGSAVTREGALQLIGGQGGDASHPRGG
jgi:hypothetical protein